MDWLLNTIKQEIFISSIKKIFIGKDNKSTDKNNGSLIYFLFMAYIYLIVFCFIFVYLICKLFFYTIPKHLIIKYRSLKPKQQAFVRISILPIIILPFVAVEAENLALQDYETFALGAVLTIGAIAWWAFSVKAYRRLITPEEREMVHYIVCRARISADNIRYWLKKAVSKVWTSIFAWGIVIYKSVFCLYSCGTQRTQSQNAVCDMLYYNIL